MLLRICCASERVDGSVNPPVGTAITLKALTTAGRSVKKLSVVTANDVQRVVLSTFTIRSLVLLSFRASF